uniref:Uncharacterized protein n=1 Tax=Anopheles dirus TaxID=7168 RepID=A0A182NYM8_9DIPT
MIKTFDLKKICEKVGTRYT